MANIAIANTATLPLAVIMMRFIGGMDVFDVGEVLVEVVGVVSGDDEISPIFNPDTGMLSISSRIR